MSRRLPLLFALLLLFSGKAHATWAWMSPEQCVKNSHLIAILNVGTIHEVVTPEGILVQSATATVEKVVYYQFEKDNKLPDNVVVWAVDANNGQTTGSLSLCTGRVLAMLQMNGFNKFILYHGDSLRPIGPEQKIWWCGENGRREEVPLSRAISELTKITEKRKPSR